MTVKVSSVEAELVKATKFKNKYDNRQDYLAALLRIIDSKLTNDDYDNLSDEAVDWHTKAVEAFEAEDDIPDFEAVDPSDLPLSDPKHPIQEPEENDDENSEEPDDIDEPDTAGGSDEGQEPDAENADSEPEAEALSADREVAKPARKVKAEKKPKEVPFSERGMVEDYTKLTGEKNKFGIIAGTKTAKAVDLYEQGVTAKQIMDALGGRHYNVLNRLKAEGHKVEKSKDGIWKLTHKDNLPKK